MNPKEVTPIQHQIEINVTCGMGFTDNLYSKAMRGRRLKWEDDTDVQFDLAYQSLRSALVTGRKDLCGQFYPECWKLINLRRRLAFSQPAVFVTNPDQVQKAIEITTSTADEEPIYDYQLPRVLSGVQSQPTPRHKLSTAELVILHVGQDQPLPTVIDPNLARLFRPEEIINGYLSAIEGDIQYYGTF